MPISCTPLRILATGRALPGRRVSSAELDRALNLPAGSVQAKSGIEYRYYAADDESQSQLAAKAVRDAVANAGVEASSIDLLISACGVQEQALPSTGSRVLQAAGLPAGTPSFDVNASCLSFLVALQTAAALLAAGSYRRIAIVSADIASRGLDWSEPEASWIFGDGAAAAIVEAGNGQQGVRAYRYETYPEGVALCEIRAGGTRRTPANGAEPADYLFRMQGRRVFRLAARLLPGFLTRLLQSAHATLDSFDAVVPHQASHLGLAHLAQRLKIPAARIVDVYSQFGNQVAASLPNALHVALASGRLGPGKRALLIGTAAGMSLGGLVLDH